MNSDRNEDRKPNRMRVPGIAGVLILAVGASAYLLTPMTVQPPNPQSASHTAAGGSCALNEVVTGKVKAASIGEMRAFAPMDRPYSLAEFSFADESGTPKTIADWQGRTVLVNLWATWCAPCRAEMPSLDELQGTLGSESFEVLPISVDRSEPSKPKGFFEEIAIKEMGFYHDKEAMTLNALKREGLALGLPATLLVDGRGCAIGRINGPAEWASQDAQNLIKAAL